MLGLEMDGAVFGPARYRNKRASKKIATLDLKGLWMVLQVHLYGNHSNTYYCSIIVDPHSGICSVCVLPYLLRDPRCRPDHEKLICIVPVSCMNHCTPTLPLFASC